MFRLTDEQLKTIEDQCFVDTTNDVKYPPLALSFGKNIIQTKTGKIELPVPIGTYGNFSFVQAPPKH